ncbi:MULTISPECIES: hypothetical protein [Novilysobacter]|uniref:hypothetical protein n=1 Tax=Novilysobacter TaxID=3382699 RepID=UPI002ED908DF
MEPVGVLLRTHFSLHHGQTIASGDLFAGIDPPPAKLMEGWDYPTAVSWAWCDGVHFRGWAYHSQVIN